MEFCHITQAGLELLSSGNPLAPASQIVGITGLSYHTQPICRVLTYTSRHLIFPVALQIRSI